MSLPSDSSGPHTAVLLAPQTFGRPAQLLVIALRDTAVLIGKQLAAEGMVSKWRLQIAHSVAAACERLKQANFDLIVADLGIEEVRTQIGTVVAAAGSTLVYGLCDDEHGEHAVNARRHGVADVLSSLHLQGPSTARLFRMMLESARAASNARLLAAAVEGAPVAYAMADALQRDMPLVYVNEYFVALTGYQPNEVIGRNSRFLQGPRTDSRDVDRIREAIRKARPLYIELVNYRKDGQTFWNGMLLRPIRSANGTVTHFLATLRDMSERRQTEESLERAARMHRLLVAASGGMTLYADANGQLRAPIPEFEAFTGLRFEAYRNCDWSAAVHPDDRAEFLAKRAAALRDTPRSVDPIEGARGHDRRAGLGCVSTFRVMHAPTQQWRYMELRMLPLHDPDGALIEWIGTITDIDDRMSSEQAQLEGQQFLRAALEAAPSRMLFVDRDAIVRWAGPSCTAWLQCGEGDLCGNALLELVDAAGRELLARPLQAALAGHPQRLQGTLTVRGHTATLDIALIPYRPDDQSVAGFFWVANDRP